ncbi:Ies1p NDAI_0G03300 [Naumovozyma dairenensis CBS 421]|uniref:Ino eighty subunit 1 n=1 Tax=Naumovozyma dairenensis (strain ATCC 10597 / BCRC 20456 / CBS 421 / NBRC 0211 / NRRL Y-12639) TaxID=1071378 RepID=G0WE96_NAUDC|nr:hypothetical protein NDAI_0G03300 [Naumovozyma dairenensis CBS 421]CCD26107.2 hypothetical protein NDAI_0G03300 [Naumovozyma dairenensis CBS 421]
MGGRVYDPIHDIFQDTIEKTPSSSSNQNEKLPITIPTSTSNVKTTSNISQPSSSTITSSHSQMLALSNKNKTSNVGNILNNTHNDNDSETTQSDEDGISSVMSAAPSHLLNFKPSIIKPWVKTTEKKLKNSTKYTRHLKKLDGEFFTRKDIQFHFLTLLLQDERLLFTNIFKQFFKNSIVPIPNTTNKKVLNVTDKLYDARKFIFNDKLTFSQLYLLTIATSSKCSKILRDKLLIDPQIAFSTCILSLLVNIGKLNTTINFYVEMTSQLRTFHSVPSLQCHSTDPKSLQDTPRLKSILKNLPLGNQPIFLQDLYRFKHPGGGYPTEHFNIINLLFCLCDNVELIKMKLLTEKYIDCENYDNATFFNLLDCSYFNPMDRCNVILWLIYLHLETSLTKEEIWESTKYFTGNGKPGRISLQSSKFEYDTDPIDEYQFGVDQQLKRSQFLSKLNDQKKQEQGEKEGGESQPEAENNILLKKKTTKSVHNQDNEDGDEDEDVHEDEDDATNDESMLKQPEQEKAQPLSSSSFERVIPTDFQNATMPMVTIPETVTRKRKLKQKNIDDKDDSEKLSSAMQKKNAKDSTSIHFLTNNNDEDDDTMNDTSIKTNTADDSHEKIPQETQGKKPTRKYKKNRKKRRVVSTATNDVKKTIVDTGGVELTPEDEEEIMAIIRKRQNEKNNLQLNKINKLIEFDRNKLINLGIAGAGDGDDKFKKQDEFIHDLLESHKLVRFKRKEIGLIKIFNEFEDVPMASGIGIRGKRRRKFKDSLLGFETDYLRDLQIGKRKLLEKYCSLKENDDKNIPRTVNDTNDTMFKL